MTAHEFFDLWPLWTYLFGVVSTVIARTAVATYHDCDTADWDDFIGPTSGLALIWPLYGLYLSGKGIGWTFRSRKNKVLARKREQKLLADKHAKLLKEAGL